MSGTGYGTNRRNSKEWMPVFLRPAVNDMRFLLRLAGTWMLGMALVLLIMDGTKSMAANALMITSMGDVWAMVHPSSLLQFETMISTSPVKFAWGALIGPILGWPGWAVLGVPGIILALWGRSRKNGINNYTQV